MISVTAKELDTQARGNIVKPFEQLPDEIDRNRTASHFHSPLEAFGGSLYCTPVQAFDVVGKR
jgi:hypothetical protein